MTTMEHTMISQIDPIGRRTSRTSAIRRTVAITALAVFDVGCSHDDSRLQVAFIPDLSKSIEPTTRGAYAKTILSASAKLMRGDVLAVIPITDDAGEQTPAK